VSCLLPILLLGLNSWAQQQEPCPRLPTHVAHHEKRVSFECISFEGHKYAIARVKTDQRTHAVVLSANQKTSLDNLSAMANQTEDVLVAMNAGMFKEGEAGKYEAQGLLVHDGRTVAELEINDSTGNGNFYWKPNGVFWTDEAGKPHVTETSDFAHTSRCCVKEATQSGPLLVLRGVIHPSPGTSTADQKFLRSATTYIRNGVGVRKRSELLFAISIEPVRMVDLARLFLYRLHCHDSLYLDGAISEMFLPKGLGAHGTSVLAPDGASENRFVTMIAISATSKY
jgi:uncharacterized protein YigE (DUF2233 family)